MKSTGYSCTSQRQQRRANRVGLLVVLIMLFSALYSTIGNITPVDAAPPDVADTEASLLQDDATDDQADADDVQDDVVDDVTDDAVDDATDDITDDATDEEDVTDDATDEEDVTDDATDEEDVTDDAVDDSIYDPEAETGYLEIYKYNCDPGYTGDGASFDDYNSNCTEPASGIQFDLFDVDGPTDSGSTDGGGFVDFDEIEPGFVSIAETVDEGYGEPVVFCSWGADQGSAGQYSQAQVTDGFYITVEYDPDFYYSCYWFNFPTADYGITIYKYICDSPDYVPVLGEWSLEDYQFYCEGSYDDYEDFAFELLDSSGVPTSQVVGDQIPNGVYFDEYEYGAVTLTELSAEGFGTPVVYCGLVPPGTDAPLEPEEMQVSSEWSVSFDAEENAQYACHWFNIPSGHDVTIYKYYCDPDYEVADYDYQWYFDNCTEWHDGATFWVDDESKSIEGTDNVWYDDVPAGELTIREEHEEGYSTPVVYCWLVGPEPALSEPQLMQLSETGEWTYPYQEGYRLICYVYNVPYTSGIDIYKWECPPEYAYSEDATYDELSENCTTAKDDVEFSLGNGTESYDSGLTGDDGPGYLRFDTYEPGQIVITETPLEGYGKPLVFCTYQYTLETTSSIALEQEEVAEDWSISTSLEEGYQVVCHWFNFPDTGHDVTIYKYYCDPDYEVADYDYQWYFDNCTDWHDGATFWIGDESKSIEGTDNVWYDDVAYGDLTIREDHEEGYGTPIVFCWQVGEDTSLAAPVKYTVSETGEWTTPYAEGYRLICYVYNIPEYDPDIVIHKYYCPEDFVPQEGGSLQYYQGECTFPHADVPFGVYDSSDSSVASGDTDSEGYVEFSGLAAGTYRIEETPPEGYGALAVYCSNQGDPLQYDLYDGSNIDVELGEPADPGYLECWWFNYPDRHDVTIYKFWCEPGYTPESIDYTTYLETCTTVRGGETFYIGDEEKTIGEDAQNSASNSVVWDDVEPGDLTLGERKGEGYGTPVIFCWLVGEDASLATPQQMQVTETGEWTYPYQEGYQLICFVFNVPTDEHDITIYKYYCDEAYDYAQYDYQWYADNCIDWHDGATFWIGDESKAISESAFVWWDDVAYGDLTIREEHEDGYGTPVIYCWQVGEDTALAAPTRYDVSDTGEWTVPYAEGYRLICYVYNQPDDHDITIYKYYCDEAYDPSQYDYQWYADNCTDWHDGATFWIGDESKAISGTDNVWWDDLPYGDLTIREEHEDGYGIPVIYCSQVGDDPSLAEPKLYEASEAGEWTAPYQEGYKLVCYVYNIPGYHDITIYKYYCEAAYDPATTDYAWYRDNCTNWYEGDTFHVNGDAKTIGEDATNALENSVWWNDVPAGSVTIGETIPDGYGRPIVYCWLITPDQDPATYQDTAPTAYEVSETGEIVLDYPENYRIVCIWYNFPEEYDVWIYKFYCEPGYRPETTHYQSYYETCTTTHDGAVFNVGDQTKTVGPDSPAGEPNKLIYNDVPTGQLTIGEELPEGYGVPYVWCWLVGPDQDPATYQETAPTAYEVSETGEIVVDYPEGYRLICFWFNFPDDHDVVIYKYYCESAWQEHYDYYWYRDNCHTTRSGDTFHVNGDAKTIGEDAGNELSNSLVWEDVPAGNVTIGETVPEGYGRPVVYCWLVGPNDDFEDYQDTAPRAYEVSETGEIVVDYPEGYYLICIWYNFPEDHDIVIYKYICPYGYDYENATEEELHWYCDVVAIPIPFAIGDDSGTLESQETGAEIPGGVAFDGYADGPYTISEEIPEGYGEPRVFCRVETTTTEPILFASAEPTEYEVTDGSIELGGEAAAAADYDYSWWCDWFNFEGQADDNTLTIHKWECPVFDEGVVIEDTQSWLKDNCIQAMEGVTFTLDDLAGPRSKDTDNTGTVFWDDMNNGPVVVTEDIPTGYGQPSVFCGWTAFWNGAVFDAFPQKVDAPDGVWTTSFDVPNTDAFCDWFNFPDQPGDITIYKYWCPIGYDLYAWGSDPIDDCKTVGEGITFDLDGDEKQTDGDGTVFWGDLDPGTYTVTEQYPPDTQYSFVLNCYGGRWAGIQPYPLQFDPDLEVKLAAGDHIYCYWYNVPKYEDGWITVYKYWCSTKTYKSEVDCQIYENGMEFDLNTYPGDDLVASGTTDGYGKWTWYNVPEGDYKIEEKGYSWCAIDISKEGPDESIRVDNNEETVVKVYNCDPPKDTPDTPDTPDDPDVPTKKPNPKNPTKYPNTGADPTALTLPSTGAGPLQGGDMTAIIILAVLAALTLAAGGFVLRRRPTPEDRAESALSSDIPSYNRRTVVGTALAAVTVPFAAVAAQDGDDNDRVPEEDELATPWATPDVPQCREDATPDASDPDEDPDCIRGEVPKHIAIAAIGVDADIEIQEIIAGELQDPTGPTLVTWYKDTSRLGERGNGVYAGHLNYWGVPEGVFFAIKTLQLGEEIILTGENDEEFVYAVQWVENQPGQDDPEPEVLGLTEDEAITLITCGGEWDTTIAEYNERTTVRAIRRKPEPAS